MKPEPGKRICDPNTPEWYAARNHGIGASEIAAVLGLSPHEDKLDVYTDKVIGLMAEGGAAIPDIAGELGVSQEYVIETLNPAERDDAWFGKAVEPVIAEGFTRFTGIPVIATELGMYQHRDEKWMFATPDSLLQPAETQRLGEWKSLDPWYAGHLGVSKSDELPASCAPWHLQAQQQMEVCAIPVVIFGVLIGRKVKAFPVQKDDRLAQAIIEGGREMWERIENRDPPPPNYEHPKALELQKRLHRDVEGTRIWLSAEGVQRATRRKEIKEQLKALGKELDAIDAALLDEIGNHAAGVLPDMMELRREHRDAVEVAAHTKKAHIQLHYRKYKRGDILDSETDGDGN